MTRQEGVEPEIALRLHDPRVVDSRNRMTDISAIPPEDLGEIVRVMDALFRWREAERRVTEASKAYMHLGESDMKALRFAMVMADQGRHVTAKDIADHLGISSASTTKLLDRLEVGGHIRRTRHPSDRRALAIVVNDDTRRAAEETVGREYARRFRIAASLSPADRDAVIRFLEALSATNEAEWPQPHGSVEGRTGIEPA